MVLPSDPAGDVSITFTLVDARSEATNVAFRYSTDGGVTWAEGTVTYDTNLRDLATSPDGVEHTIVWDSVEDVGFRVPDEIRIALEASNGRGSTGLVEATDRVVLAGLKNLPYAANRVESYMIHFGAWDAATIALAEKHDLVILYPCEPTATRQVIEEIQNGVDPRRWRDDVIVLGYLNVGEDDRTIGLTDAQLLADARFRGDGSGPRVDPRGPGPDGRSLNGIKPLGNGSTSAGYASWYLDDNSIEKSGTGDGKPDRNGVTGACYVNAGDPKWYAALRDMRCDSPDKIVGIREMLSRNYGRAFECDGLMLDNVDTCAPNSFTGPSDIDHATFEWTAPGMAEFIAQLRRDYPRHIIMQNRGLFFMNPAHRHYAFTTRRSIDFLKFESYRLDRETKHEYDNYFFADNKFNLAPRLQAEANRPDGFQVLSLGYATGPGIDSQTLIGKSAAGAATLKQDIVEAHEVVGFRHYLTDNAGSLVNEFVRKNASFTDTKPPVWSSTYNANQPGFPTPPSPPTPRAGVQQLVAIGNDRVVARWDVALDLHPVFYLVYTSSKPIKFSSKGKVKGAKRRLLWPSVGTGYANGVGPSVYPYESRISGFEEGDTVYCCIRAIDIKGNEDTNQVVLSVKVR